MLCSCHCSHIPTKRQQSSQAFERCAVPRTCLVTPNTFDRAKPSSKRPTRCSAATQSRPQYDLPVGLPTVDWTRYHLQVLFVDRTDTVRARVAAGLFERIAEWNGFGRALYPWACGVEVTHSKPRDLSTTASLFSQAQFLGIRAKLFAAPAEQLILEDLDRYDVIVALDQGVRANIIKKTSPEWHSYYADKIYILDQFSQCCGSDILKTGGSALLERELSAIVQPVMQKDVKIPDVLRPDLLQKGPEKWNTMVQAMIISCAGLVQYLIDVYPEDMPYYDPQ